MHSLIDPSFNSFIGSVAVTFFFVLSGFLITRLLLNEKAGTGTIRLKRFFINRALRIWPLYYIVLVAGYAVSIYLFRETSRDPIGNGFILNALLLPNVAFAFSLFPEILVQIWSIGTEEQFYFTWPFIVRRYPERTLVRVFVGVIVSWLAVRAAVCLLYGSGSWLNVLIFRTRIDCMAIGGLAALLVFYCERSEGWWTGIHRLLLQRGTGWIAAGIFILLLMISYRYRASLYQLYAVLSSILILRVITGTGGWLESGVLRYLGKISYGIYMLQHFAIFFIFRFFHLTAAGLPAGIGIFLLASLLTTGLATLSYSLIERPFLKRKN